MIIHHGKLLKYYIEVEELDRDAFAKKLNWSRASLYNYFKAMTFKPSIMEELRKAGVPMEYFSIQQFSSNQKEILELKNKYSNLKDENSRLKDKIITLLEKEG